MSTSTIASTWAPLVQWEGVHFRVDPVLATYFADIKALLQLRLG